MLLRPIKPIGILGIWPCAYVAWIDSIGADRGRNRIKRPSRSDLGALRSGTKFPMNSNSAL
jgi:hypothetical protein